MEFFDLLGPFFLSVTEKVEEKNGNIRSKLFLTNRSACSEDLAEKFVVEESLRLIFSGGKWMQNNQIVSASPAVINYANTNEGKKILGIRSGISSLFFFIKKTHFIFLVLV